MSGELADVVQVVAAVEYAQQHELVDEFVGLFRADAIWTTGHGKLLIGRDDIAAFTKQVLPGAMAEATVSFEVTHVLFIRPDVAAVKVRQISRDGISRDGISRDGEGRQAEGTPLFVMSKEDGQWRLVACQNTAVVAL